TAVSRAVHDRLRQRTEEALERHRGLIDARAARGVPRDTHGDLHLDHVYLFPGRPPPGDLVAIDCIEFNERFRYADPVADAAGLAADAPARSAYGAGLYSPEWTERTYAECLRRAEALLFEGQRVVVDATFGDDGRRRTFLEAAGRWAVPAVILLCEADPETVR